MHCRASAAREPRERITRRKLDSLAYARRRACAAVLQIERKRTHAYSSAGDGEEGRKETGISSPFRARLVHAYLLVKEDRYSERVGRESTRKDKRLTKGRRGRGAATTDCNDDDDEDEEEDDDDVMHYAERSPARVSICPGAVYCRLAPLRIRSRLNAVSNMYIRSTYKVVVKHAVKFPRRGEKFLVGMLYRSCRLRPAASRSRRNCKSSRVLRSLRHSLFPPARETNASHNPTILNTSL